MPVTKQQALDYHQGARLGKIEVTPTKPCRTQRVAAIAVVDAQENETYAHVRVPAEPELVGED